MFSSLLAIFSGLIRTFDELSYFGPQCHIFGPRLSYFHENGLATLLATLERAESVSAVLN